MIRALSLLAIAAAASACGNGNDPLSILGDPSASLVDSLALPYNAAGGGTGGTPVTLSAYGPFIKSNTTYDGLDFLTLTPGTYQVTSPAAGVISQADSASVTIYHNVHVTSRLSRMTGVSVRVGDYVSAGSIVGTTGNSIGNFIIAHMTVFVDGATVCPYGYLVPSAKTLINATAASTGAAFGGPCRE